MKKKHAKIIVKTIENTKLEWKEALQGKRKRIQKDDEIIFASLEAVARVFSKGRMEILSAVIQKRPKSIYELAKLLDRDFKTVHTDVKLLADIGLLDLKEAGTSRNGLIPLAKFSGIDLDWAA
jgi:predicted transcriptional regulator